MHLVDRTQLRRRGAPHEARFITFSCDARRRLLSPPQRKDHFVRLLRERVSACAIELHAWVVMSNHVHLLLTPRTARLVPWLGSLKRSYTQSLPGWPGGPFWMKGGGYDRAIWSVEEFEEKFAYIHRNPVSVGLASCATDYRWSSATDWFISRRPSAPRLHERPSELSEQPSRSRPQ